MKIRTISFFLVIAVLCIIIVQAQPSQSPQDDEKTKQAILATEQNGAEVQGATKGSTEGSKIQHFETATSVVDANNRELKNVQGVTIEAGGVQYSSKVESAKLPTGPILLDGKTVFFTPSGFEAESGVVKANPAASPVFFQGGSLSNSQLKAAVASFGPVDSAFVGLFKVEGTLTPQGTLASVASTTIISKHLDAVATGIADIGGTLDSVTAKDVQSLSLTTRDGKPIGVVLSGIGSFTMSADKDKAYTVFSDVKKIESGSNPSNTITGADMVIVPDKELNAFFNDPKVIEIMRGGQMMTWMGSAESKAFIHDYAAKISGGDAKKTAATEQGTIAQVTALLSEFTAKFGPTIKPSMTNENGQPVLVAKVTTATHYGQSKSTSNPSSTKGPSGKVSPSTGQSSKFSFSSTGSFSIAGTASSSGGLDRLFKGQFQSTRSFMENIKRAILLPSEENYFFVGESSRFVFRSDEPSLIMLLEGAKEIEFNGLLYASFADLFVRDRTVLGEVHDLIAGSTVFYVGRAEWMISECARIYNIRNSTLAITDDRIEISTMERHRINITDCLFNNVFFESHGGSFSMTKLVPPTYNISNGTLIISQKDYTERVEVNNSALIEFDLQFGIACITMQPEVTYWYNDHLNLKKDFAINVPPNAPNFKLCIRRSPDQNLSNYDGLINFVKDYIYLTKEARYYRYPFKNNEVSSLLMGTLHHEMNNFTSIIQLDDSFIEVDKIEIQGQETPNEIKADTKPNNFFTIREKQTDEEVHRLAKLEYEKHSKEITQPWMKNYRTDYFESVLYRDGLALIQRNEFNDIRLLPAGHSEIETILI